MANIDLVIRIPEEIRSALINNIELSQDQKAFSDSFINHAIINGTPLPKGHGALKDENYFLNILRCEDYDTCTWRNCSECNREKCIKKYDVVDAPTILEADKENI